MKIGIIDADLISRTKHRFPNLACMKLSAYWQNEGGQVSLLTKYDQDEINSFDKIFCSKVFTDTIVPDWLLQLPNVMYGGTGFYYDKAEPLPDQIEHCMPDYHLYDLYVNDKIVSGCKRNDFKYYLDYSIGFLTRGCFRKCDFCVNKNYNQVLIHSPLTEFLDENRRKICLLDDNVLGCSEWQSLLTELQSTGKPFQFKQGLDERILTDEKCELLFKSKYDGDYIFAFDNIDDKKVIKNKLNLIRQYTNKWLKFYCLCAYDRNDKYDADFWEQDLFDLFERIKILMDYNCLPYIMRFAKYKESPYQKVYTNIARWCNQPSIYKKRSFKQFCIDDDKYFGGQHKSSSYKSLELCEQKLPNLVSEYFDLVCK